MDDPISVMTWNLNGERGISDERMQVQLEFLDEHAAVTDIVMFQAVNYEPEDGEQWGGQLGSLLEYFESSDQDYHYAHTADWAHELYESDVQPHQAIESPHNRCNLTVSRCPVERTPLSLRQFNRPKELTYYTTHFPQGSVKSLGGMKSVVLSPLLVGLRGSNREAVRAGIERGGDHLNDSRALTSDVR